MTEIEKNREILRFVRDIKENWGDDPFAIAELCGINVIERKALKPSGTTIRMKGYPVIISLSGCSTEAARRVICAHELGHALLHADMMVNRFDGTYDAIQSSCEHEANLFAVALLFNEDDFNRPLESMGNWTLKSILDYNLK